MLIRTTQLGEWNVVERDIITFSQGVPGFEEYRRFVILTPDADIPFSYIQSVDEERLHFLLTNPFLFYPNYEFDLPDSVKDELKIVRHEEVGVWSIVTLKDQIADATLNLLAPVIINVAEGIGKQIILHNNTNYKTKHLLFPVNQVESRR